MAQAQMARITCRVCDGWYASENDLREHMQAAHRRFIPAPDYPAPGNPQDAGPQPEKVKTETRTANEEWKDEESSPVSVHAGRAGR